MEERNQAIRKNKRKAVLFMAATYILVAVLMCAVIRIISLPNYMAMIIVIAIGALQIANWMNTTEYRRLKEEDE